MARPTKLTPETQDRIVTAIRLGATYELAAQYGGIHYDTFRVWMDKYPAFSEAIKKAEGEALVGWLAKIEKAANDGAWQAAAWKAERRYPHVYGRTVQAQEHSGELTITKGYTTKEVSPDAWDDATTE